MECFSSTVNVTAATARRSLYIAKIVKLFLDAQSQYSLSYIAKFSFKSDSFFDRYRFFSRYEDDESLWSWFKVEQLNRRQYDLNPEWFICFSGDILVVNMSAVCRQGPVFQRTVSTSRGTPTASWS